MKRILIVNKSFATGGIQSSMVNMANQLSKFYKVDILVYYPEGPIPILATIPDLLSDKTYGGYYAAKK